jgi:arylsulfatase A-like enzyme/Tfp pilus assembly protein PilF
LIVIAAVGWGTLRLAGIFGRGARPKNVLLITMDTTRADYLGCFGRTSAQTPNIDRLAREGTVFTRCTTCSPLTLPSHSSIMTGVYPYVHGARQNGIGHLASSNVTLAEVLKKAGFATQAAVGAFVLNAQFGIDQGFEVYHDVKPAVAGNPLTAQRKGDEVCDDALKLLQALAGGPRFFLWVHFYDPHHPYESPRVNDIDSPAAYADEIAFMDTQIGRLLDKLRALGRERDTLVVLVADHGEGLGEHDELMHGYLLYETTVHAPLIFRCPGIIPAAKSVGAQVRTIDLAPTILNLTGSPASDRAQGVSLATLLSGQEQDLHLTAYSEAFDAQIEYGLSQLRSLSAGPWKYILAPNAELYDLGADPGETANLLAEQTARAAEMRGELHQLIADAPAPPGVEEAAQPLTGADARSLETLGYVAAPAAFNEEGVAELDRFEPRGGDPKQYVHLLRLVVHDLPLLRAQKDWPRAEQLLRQLIEALPEASHLQVQLAAVLQPQGRIDEAMQAFEHALKLAPDDYDIRRKYATFLARIQRYADAGREFDEVLKRLPGDTFTLIESADALAALGQLDQAQERLQRALAIEPKSTRVLRALGAIAEKRGQFAEAARQYQAALDIDPNFKECREDLERVQQALGHD